jgi:hypothetical protein
MTNNFNTKIIGLSLRLRIYLSFLATILLISCATEFIVPTSAPTVVCVKQWTKTAASGFTTHDGLFVFSNSLSHSIGLLTWPGGSNTPASVEVLQSNRWVSVGSYVCGFGLRYTELRPSQIFQFRSFCAAHDGHEWRVGVSYLPVFISAEADRLTPEKEVVAWSSAIVPDQRKPEPNKTPQRVCRSAREKEEIELGQNETGPR